MLNSCAFCIAAIVFLPACWTESRAEVMSLPVPVRTLYPNDELHKEDFTWKQFEVNDIARRNYFTGVDPIIANVALRALPAGRPVPLRAVKRRSDVRKGEQTLAHYEADGIEIQGILVPEQDAVVGQMVQVKNPQTGVLLFARVAMDGTLIVEMQ